MKLATRVLLVAATLCLASGAPAQGRVVPATSIENLVRKAKPGGIVKVPPGIYLEDVVIPEGVSLAGSGANHTIIVGSLQLSGTLEIPVSLSQVTVIHTGGSSSSAVTCKSGTVKIRNSLLISEGGFSAVAVGKASKGILHNNIIVGPVGDYAVFGRHEARIEIVNNTIVVQGFGIGLMDQTRAIIRNCLFYGDAKPAVIRTSSDYSISYSNISLTGGSFYFNYDLINNDITLRHSAHYPNNPSPPDLSNKDSGKYESAGLTFLSHEHVKSRRINDYRQHQPKFARHAGSPNKIDNNSDGSRNTLGAFGGPLGSRW